MQTNNMKGNFNMEAKKSYSDSLFGDFLYLEAFVFIIECFPGLSCSNFYQPEFTKHFRTVKVLTV